MEESNVSNTSTIHRRYLIIHNISKLNNILQLIKLAIAYSVTPVVVGCRAYRAQIDKLLSDYTHTSAFFFRKLHEAKEALNVPIIGIEIDDSAVSVIDYEPGESYALLPGNEGTGLSDKDKGQVDKFVYIPQYGHGTASLNVHVATTLVLHRFVMSTAV
jgi:TrmH family RNA methyltransferase